MEQLDYNLHFRWVVGLSIDDRGWDPTVFTKNRERLLRGDIARAFWPSSGKHPTGGCDGSGGCSPWGPRCTTWCASET
jgi:Transposase domain (DUF772)